MLLLPLFRCTVASASRRNDGRRGAVAATGDPQPHGLTVSRVPAHGSVCETASNHRVRASRRRCHGASLADERPDAIEGPDGLAFEQVREVDEKVHEAALLVVRTVGHLPGVRDMTNHMMGITQVA